jgi:hypothetical protein
MFSFVTLFRYSVNTSLLEGPIAEQADSARVLHQSATIP